MTTMQEFVVPRSIPTTLLNGVLLLFSILPPDGFALVFLSRVSCFRFFAAARRRPRHAHHGRPQQTILEEIALLKDRKHRAVGMLLGLVLTHGLVKVGIERLALALDLGEPQPVEDLLELSMNERDTVAKLLIGRSGRIALGALQIVEHRKDFLHHVGACVSREVDSL